MDICLIRYFNECIIQLFQNIDGVNYIYMKQHGLYFLITTRFNCSPAFAIEFLSRLGKVLCCFFHFWSLRLRRVMTLHAQVFKDYCGVLTEEAIRKNFVLIYELLDEIMVR